MATEVKKEIALEIAHVLFIDIVGYSKLPITEQRTVVEHLNEIVRGTDQVNLKYSRRSRLARLTWTSALIPFGTRCVTTRASKKLSLRSRQRTQSSKDFLCRLNTSASESACQLPQFGRLLRKLRVLLVLLATTGS
jgi:hypothetical protein